MRLEAAIQGHDAGAGRPVHSNPGTTSTAPISICAAIASVGRALAFTAAFQPACSKALASAATTCRTSIVSVELAVINAGRAEPASRPERVIRNDPDQRPAKARVEPLGVIAGDRK